ncbi:MAG: CHAT domain-containing protein [Elainellaceae cyanobacterium]
MRILHLDLKPIQGETVELRSFWENPNEYDDRTLALAEIQTLIQQVEEDYYVSPRLQADLATTGRRLFQWLDGSNRWLVSKLAQHPGEVIVLAIAVAGKLAHLPWEVLHDGAQFLVQRVLAVVPVRWQSSDAITQLELKSEPENRALNVLFMATSPQDVTPVLDYEQEEAEILKATARTTIGLTVEESGCLEELGNLVADYGKGFFDVVHLTGHATIQEGESYFITETATGEAHLATARAIARTLRLPLPKLVFLSGCRTGQAANAGAVPSMAEQLLQSGATAVLGWGQKVLDTDATAAAAALYGALSTGSSVTEAVAATYQKLIEQEARDWHLLRLYAGKTLPAALVKPANTIGWKRAPKPSIATEFLDPLTQTIKVPTRESFVGRRRQLQNSLRALTPPSEAIAVLIHGMGGLGKSSLAARLCDRLPQFRRLVWIGSIDPASLVKRLADALDQEDLRRRLKGTDEKLKHRLRAVFDRLAEQSAPRFLLVLDDFEVNLEARETSYVLKPAAAEVLEALVWAIQDSNAPHRLLLTSRYDFDTREILKRAELLYRQPLDALQGADLQKKCSRLSALKPPDLPAQVTEDDQAAIAPLIELLELQKQAKHLADGNPRLLETLNDEVLAKPTIDRAAKLEQLEADPKDLRDQVLEPQVVEQMQDGLATVLARGLVFELPVPKEAFDTVTKGSEQLDRAIALGLLEVSPDQTLRVPRILPLSLPTETQPLYQEAARSLYRLWWQENQATTEAQVLEVHRLALLAEDQAIAAELGAAMGHRWHNQSRFRDAVALGEKTVALAPDYRVYHSLARSQATLGAVQAALENYEKARATCPEEDQQEKAAIEHNLADIYAQQGQVEQAIELYQQALDLHELIGHVKGKATSLHQLAGIYAQQGQVEQAIELYQQALDLHESIGNVKGKAPTLRRLGGIHQQQGQIEQALSLFQESLKIEESIGDIQGQAEALGWIATIYAQQGQVEQAIELYQQSLDLHESIGNVRGKAATLHNLADIYAQQGQVEQAIDLYQQVLAIDELIGNMRGKAATLHQLAGIYAQQGQVEQAIDLYQQSLDLKELIGDVQGKAATLTWFAGLAGQQGDTAKQFQLNLQAAELLGQMGAYVDLVTVLSNLGTTPSEHQQAYLAQALWLALTIQPPFAKVFSLLRVLFNQVDQGDPLEPLLAVTAYYLALNQDETYPDLAQFQQQAMQMLTYVAQSQGIQTQEALQTWMAEQQLNDPNLFLPQLRDRLAALVGDRWVFER